MSNGKDEDPGKTVGEDYYQHLLDLTENSRPIIVNLTTIANENVMYADQITKSIELRIKNCLPNYKLFALYLLDSICKNIGNPYNVLFGARLYQIFSSVYSVVSDSIRNKLINLFKTWKEARTLTGLPLFPVDQIEKIEQFLIKATSGNKVDKNYLIKDCHDLILLIGRRIQIDPTNFEKIQNKIGLLNDLLNILVNTNPSQEELKYIMEHFKNVRIEEQHIILRLEFEQKRKEEELLLQEKQKEQFKKEQEEIQRQLLLLLQQPVRQEQQHSQQYQQQFQQPQSQLLGQSQSLGLNLGFNLADLNDLLQLPKASPKSPSELLEQLSKQNIEVPKTANVNTSPEALRFILNSVTVEVKPVEEILSKYDQLQSNESFVLDNVPSNEDLNLLYNYKKFKCSLCGKRFDAQTKVQPHLDWHFRTNRNLKITTSNTIQSRNYYLDDNQFINFKEVEIIGYAGLNGNNDNSGLKPMDLDSSMPNGNNSGNNNNGMDNNNNTNNNSYANDAGNSNNTRHYVVIQTDNMVTKCSVCKEIIRGKYDDDINEWIWDNCIEIKQKQGSKIYHWSCYNENLRNSTTSGSTPQTTNATPGLGFDLNMLKDIVMSQNKR